MPLFSNFLKTYMKKIKYDTYWHMNGFGVGALWNRYDSLDVCVQKANDFLRDFVELCPEWFPFRMYSSFKGALTSFNSEIPPLPELHKIIEEGRDKDSDSCGYHVFFNNVVEKTDHRMLIEFRLTCGAYGKQGNSISISFPPYNEKAKRIATKEFYFTSLKLIMKHWIPYRCNIGIPFVMIKDYAKVGNDAVGNVPCVGWLTGFSDKLGTLPELPNWAIVTPVDGFGNYIQVSENLPDKTKEEELHDIITKVYELSGIIKPWIELKREFIFRAGI
jgi:hypothetical protein